MPEILSEDKTETLAPERTYRFLGNGFTSSHQPVFIDFEVSSTDLGEAERLRDAYLERNYGWLAFIGFLEMQIIEDEEKEGVGEFV